MRKMKIICSFSVYSPDLFAISLSARRGILAEEKCQQLWGCISPISGSR